METCRVYTKSATELHVHDNPGSVADATRCLINGWEVNIAKCLRPGVPWTSGDPAGQRPVVVDAVERG